MKAIASNHLGKLRQHQEFADWWESDPIAIPFFDHQKLKITFSDFIPNEDEDFLQEADQAIGRFLQKGKEARNAISSLIYKNCMDFLHEVGFDEADKVLWEIKDETKIWNFVYPKEIFVTRRPYNEKDMYVQICCACKWEEEHGLQIVFRQGKQVTRVSAQDGHLTEADAYDQPDEEEELLSQFKE
ncbi:MAG: hypothetical protein AAGD05_01165 [Bacteroidota bacterium]